LGADHRTKTDETSILGNQEDGKTMQSRSGKSGRSAIQRKKKKRKGLLVKKAYYALGSQRAGLTPVPVGELPPGGVLDASLGDEGRLRAPRVWKESGFKGGLSTSPVKNVSAP